MNINELQPGWSSAAGRSAPERPIDLLMTVIDLWRWAWLSGSRDHRERASGRGETTSIHGGHRHTHTERQADGHTDGQADGVSETGQYGGVMGVVVVAHR